MKINIKFFFFIPIFLFYLNSHGQTLVSNDYNLSSNYVESIFYDISGKLWIGTDEGLNLITSHDKYQFLASISNDNGLIDSEIFKLQDLKDGYTAAFSINGISIFNPNEFNFKQIRLKSRPVSIHYDDLNDEYWITSEESGLIIVDSNFNITSEYIFDPLNPLSLSSSKFSSKHNVEFISGDTYIGTTNGFNFFNGEQKTFKRFYSGRNGLNSNQIKGVFKFNNQSLLVATAKKLYIFDIVSQKFESLKFDLDALNGIYQISQNEYIISDGSQISYSIFGENREVKKSILHNFKNSNLSYFKKIGSQIFIINDEVNYFIKFDILSKSSERIKFNERINDIEIQNSNILIGTNFGLAGVNISDDFVSEVISYNDLFFYDNKYNYEVKVKKYYVDLVSHQKKTSLKIPKEIIISKETLFEINEDYLFLFDKNLHMLDLKSKQFILDVTSGDDYLNGKISSIKLIEDFLYMSTGNGIVRLNISPKSNIKKLITESLKNYEYNELFNNKVPKSFSDIEKVENYFYVGSENEGLSVYKNNLENLIHRFDYKKGDNKTLSSKSIVKIFHDDIDKSLLLATRGNGLFRLNFKDSIFKNYTANNGLLSNNVNDFAKINDRIWIQSGNGINFFEGDILRNINPEDGIRIKSYLKESIHKLENNILITGFEKAQIFDPAELERSQSYNLNLSLLNIIGYDKENVGKIISKSDSIIDINSEISSIELNLYTNAKNKNNLVQYSYKTSFGEKLLYVDNFQNKIKLNSLPFYDSQIEIYAKDGNGNINSNQLIVKFYNTPPWWLKIETIIFYVIFSIAAVYFIVKLRENQTKKHLESQRKSKELEEARNLQNSLLPKTNPVIEGYQISTFLKSATEIGGDYYDFFYEKGKYFYAICGDATGHGVISGIMVSVTKAALSGIPMSIPSKILEQLNGIVKKVNFGRLRMSLSVAKINHDSIELSSAAMPPTYYFNSKKNSLEEILVPNLPLGGMQREKFDGIKLDFQKGDMIVMISDGLPELPNPTEELLDYQKVEDCLKKNSKKDAEQVKNALVELSESWANGVPNPDDITIVVIKKAA